MVRVLSALFAVAIAQAPASGLRIVVVDGENAVNIIQQKTAVAPVVEIRDRNNLPVPGAVVTFAVEGGKAAAFAGGAPTMTVATNAAGQAVAAGFSPIASGAVQINVSALVQGQALAATITQTNVMTAAQAAAAASSASSASGASGASSASGAAGAGAGGGGGMSATTVAIVGAAVGGGAIAATQVAKEGSDATTSTTGTAPKTFTGTLSGQYTLNFVNPANGVVSCTRTHAVTGTLTITVGNEPSKVEGTAQLSGTSTVVAVTCGGGPQVGVAEAANMPPTALVGRSPGFGFDYQRSNAFQDTPTSAPGTHTYFFAFAGQFADTTTIVGTFTFGEKVEGPPGSTTGTATATFPVTLR